jgi:hypothetical protein
MDEAWFTGVADELAQCLLDAERCAEVCEALLETVRRGADAELQQRVLDILVAPAAVARILIELIDHPPHIVLAACRLSRESAVSAAEQLETLGAQVDSAGTIAALRASARSCEQLLDVA